MTHFFCTDNFPKKHETKMQRLLAWAVRDKTDDAIAASIEAAVRADTDGDYALAVDLYATGIEKMMSKLQRTYVRMNEQLWKWVVHVLASRSLMTCTCVNAYIYVELSHEDDQKQLRRKIHEYMTRAEYLKAQQQEQEQTGDDQHCQNGNEQSVAALSHSHNGAAVRIHHLEIKAELRTDHVNLSCDMCRLLNTTRETRMRCDPPSFSTTRSSRTRSSTRCWTGRHR